MQIERIKCNYIAIHFDTKKNYQFKDTLKCVNNSQKLHQLKYNNYF
jgi:hypothetical protein